ncbi:MAG: hypothetical protein LZF61_01215 [Nitrosomonas sp.]|nr:MAG: hypothetical protein LZF61_01215 [Nitrosomonas sp.]
MNCILYTVATIHWRHKEIEQAYLDTVAHLPELSTPSPEIKFLILEALYQIDRMLYSMPVRTREIFLLAQLDGLSYQEIAERTRTFLATDGKAAHA